jgi:hypothetical protein
MDRVLFGADALHRRRDSVPLRSSRASVRATMHEAGNGTSGRFYTRPLYFITLVCRVAAGCETQKADDGR